MSVNVKLKLKGYQRITFQGSILSSSASFLMAQPKGSWQCWHSCVGWRLWKPQFCALWFPNKSIAYFQCRFQMHWFRLPHIQSTVRSLSGHVLFLVISAETIDNTQTVLKHCSLNKLIWWKRTIGETASCRSGKRCRFTKSSQFRYKRYNVYSLWSISFTHNIYPKLLTRHSKSGTKSLLGLLATMRVTLTDWVRYQPVNDICSSPFIANSQCQGCARVAEFYSMCWRRYIDNENVLEVI